MKLPRRNFLYLATGAAALPAVSRMARAQAYPSRPVRIVVGVADFLHRTLDVRVDLLYRRRHCYIRGEIKYFQFHIARCGSDES
jgi:hypothetical protein